MIILINTNNTTLSPLHVPIMSINLYYLNTSLSSCYISLVLLLLSCYVRTLLPYNTFIITLKYSYHEYYSIILLHHYQYVTYLSTRYYTIILIHTYYTNIYLQYTYILSLCYTLITLIRYKHYNITLLPCIAFIALLYLYYLTINLSYQHKPIILINFYGL